jgi:hypothetical protein
MSYHSRKAKRAVWRACKNLIYTNPIGHRLIQSREALAESFGPDDAEYSWRLFERHSIRLQQVGFDKRASRILEVGPGRNIGSALLWWAACGGGDVSVTLWDTFPNTTVDFSQLRTSAEALLERGASRGADTEEIDIGLRSIVAGEVSPRIEYVVCDHATFAARGEAPYDLILSHSCFEHIWSPEPTLAMLADHTAKEGWHSVQIDLADHGSRDTNFLEMLEWSDLGYWLTMRFAPGAVNRWRAQQFIDCYEELGLMIVAADRRTQDVLPTERKRLARRFRNLDEQELLTTELHLITQGRRSAPQVAGQKAPVSTA